jgi:hypothetical protein
MHLLPRLLLFACCTCAIAAPIDREALVRRHNVVVRSVDPKSPLTVGNGGFAFTVDVTGLQTFGDHYYANGFPLETLARWCWVMDANPNGYTLDDASSDFMQADGTTVRLPNKQNSPAGEWLRRNPRLHPLGRLSLEWSDGTARPRRCQTSVASLRPPRATKKMIRLSADQTAAWRLGTSPKRLERAQW